MPAFGQTFLNFWKPRGALDQSWSAACTFPWLVFFSRQSLTMFPQSSAKQYFAVVYTLLLQPSNKCSWLWQQDLNPHEWVSSAGMVTLWCIHEGFHKCKTCYYAEGNLQPFLRVRPATRRAELREISRWSSGQPRAGTCLQTSILQLQYLRDGGSFLMLLLQIIAPFPAPSKTGPPTVYF